jgi:hypothetical protein
MTTREYNVNEKQMVEKDKNPDMEKIGDTERGKSAEKRTNATLLLFWAHDRISTALPRFFRSRRVEGDSKI